jgi:YbbR domain-containing protein
LQPRSRPFSSPDVRRQLKPWTSNLALKVTAVALAFLLWTVVKADNEVEIRDVPVRADVRDADWVVVGDPIPRSVDVTFSGPIGELWRVRDEPPVVVVPVERVSDSTEVHILRNAYVRLGVGVQNLRVEAIRPQTVQLQFERVATQLLPVAVRLAGAPRPGYELDGPVRIEPSMVRASGARSRLEATDSLRLPALDLTDRTRTDTVLLPIDTTGTALVVTPRQVQAIVRIRPAPDTLGGNAPQRAAIRP